MRDIFLERYPQIDLHGVDRETARMMTNDFVLENMMLKNKTIVIVHGKGTGIVKQACHEALIKVSLIIRLIILMMGVQ